METIKILIADDHQLVIDGLKALLKDVPQFICSAEANNGQQVLNIVRDIPIDIILMDIDMPVLNGIDVTERLAKTHPAIKVVALTMHNEKSMIDKMIDAGVKGYILKNIYQWELIEAITKIASGNPYFSSEISLKLLGKKSNEIIPCSDANPPDDLLLTKREIEIMKLIAQGFSSRTISEKLNISYRTADTHRTNLMKKMGVNSIASIVRYAIQNGFIK